ncbi:hypothetical protein ACFYRN_08360 [Streptomyces sp. NPDC005227]|uniref:hypothetical protein n=1 Tax=Streptomyces sp. NPDC005227 TaxID=3364707 RepID=UPI0036CD924A
MVPSTGIAPHSDPDACRWIAVRNQARLVHVVAPLAREDGGVHHAYRDAFQLQTECHRIATELGHLPPYITINTKPSSSVSAKGASDDLSATLLKHAGFQQIEDWYGRRHRLPTTTLQADRAAVASHAAEMLRAARYSVDLDPDLDTSRLASPANPLGLQIAGAEVLRLTDQIRAAENGAGLMQAVDHLLHPRRTWRPPRTWSPRVLRSSATPNTSTRCLSCGPGNYSAMSSATTRSQTPNRPRPRTRERTDSEPPAPPPHTPPPRSPHPMTSTIDSYPEQELPR